MNGDEEYNPNSVNAVLSRIDGKLDTLLKSQAEQQAINAVVASQIRALENWRQYALGACFVIAIVAGAAWDWIKEKFN